MFCIQDTNTDPYFNLAAEEYMLKHFSDDVFMLWRNDNAIIVGKHQNTLSEINLDHVKEKGIKVVRRISGGGAVFHDLGNLNFTFIRNGEAGNLVDFKKFTLPIIEVLQKMGVDAKFEGRNDITIEGKKFSGNAEHVWKNRTLHHGTILFSSVIADLSKALKVNPLKFKDKAVKSVRSRVTNVSEHLKEKMDVTEFSRKVMEHIMEKYDDSVLYEFTAEDIKKIEAIRDEKFATWEWNFGYSPKYNFEKLIRTNGGTLEFHIDVEKGIMKDVKIYGDFFHKHDIDIVEKSLAGVPHDPHAIQNALSVFTFDEYFKNIPVEEFIAGMF
ncbi:MAG: lipoate--protein ligase [Bacteroidales bacterium]|nr:lipoate--protein ligase [Bacteroidales bacterium]